MNLGGGGGRNDPNIECTYELKKKINKYFKERKICALEGAEI
jgi:hypothetical protein